MSTNRHALCLTATPMAVSDEAHRLFGTLPHPDADLIALCAQFDALDAEHRALYANSTVADDVAVNRAGNLILDRMNDLVDRIGFLRATTSEGIHALAHSLAAHAGHGDFSFDILTSMTGRLLHQTLRDAAACRLA